MHFKGIVEIYTDGACRGNPGPGGWGVLIVNNGEILKGSSAKTTNNIMELTAVLTALNYIKSKKISTAVRIFTDSAYIVNGYNTWIDKWQKNNWKKSDGKLILNLALWQQLINFKSYAHVQIIWVKGHSKNEHNNKVDKIAKSMIPN